MPYMLGGRQLRVGRPFKTADGVSYSQLWVTALSDEEKTALGITWKADPEPFDVRFYTAPGTPKDVDEVKAHFTAQQKELAGNMLESTDWYVTRKSETDTAIPEAVTTYRTAVRTVCAAREEKIAAVSDIAALEVLINTHPKIRNDAGEIVDNTATHLNSWPEPLS